MLHQGDRVPRGGTIEIMGIGCFMALFALLCGVVALVGFMVPQSNCKPAEPQKDYRAIYAEINPREL